MNKHTPGPWVVEKAIRSGYTIFSKEAGIVVECSDDECRYGAIENESDARLIAAAPEMLEALRNLLDEAMHSTHDCPILFARRVIAKATGDQP